MTDKKIISVLTASYGLMIALYFLGAIFSEGRIWAFNLNSFLPPIFKYFLLLAGIFIPLIVIKNLKFDNLSFEKRAENNKSYWIFSVLTIVLFGYLFYTLRAQSFFLGDGYTVLRELSSEIALIKPRALGETLSHIWLSEIFGERNEENVYLSYISISIGAGILFLIFAAFFAKIEFKDNIRRILLFLGISSGGYMLLSFGYVEYYSLFVLLTAIFTITGILISKGKINRWLIIPVWMVATFLHIFGIILIPALIYILTMNTPLGNSLKKLSLKYKILISSIVLTLFGFVFYHYYTTDYFFRFAFVPFYDDSFAYEGYTLFSFDHIIDMVNLYLFLIPGIFIFILLLFFSPKKEIIKEKHFIFLIILIISTVGAVFIFDPKLGMPRDWDLFSFSSVPISIFIYLVLLNLKINKRVIYLASIFIISLGFLVLITRAAVLSYPEFGIKQFKNYSRLDVIKNKNARIVLINNYRDDDQKDKAHQELKLWNRDFPYDYLLQTSAGSVESAEISLAKLNEILQIEPTSWNAWASLGISYIILGKYDSAMYCFDVADGINPYSSYIYAQKGNVFFKTRDFEQAEYYWLKSLETDTANYISIVGLTSLYRVLEDKELCRKYLYQLPTHPETSNELLYDFIKVYIKKNDVENARLMYKRLSEKGFDSTILNDLLSNNQYLK